MHDTHFQIASAAHGLLQPAQLHQPQQLVRQQVHVLGHRAAGRALAALVAVVNLGVRPVRSTVLSVGSRSWQGIPGYGVRAGFSLSHSRSSGRRDRPTAVQ